MKEAFWIFPHQLFDPTIILDKKKPLYLIEHPHFFIRFHFHAQKLIFHRASMQSYFHILKKKGFSVTYIAFDEYEKFIKNLDIKVLYLFDPIEKPLQNEINKLSKKIEVHQFISPMFLTSKEFAQSFFKDETHFSMTSFYIAQRKRLNLLMENGKPIGGKWTYDQENRKKIPKGLTIPKPLKLKKNPFIQEAIKYVNTHFPKAYGELTCHFPIDHQEAKKWLSHFLKMKLNLFGPYEDAICKKDPFLFHSVLSPLLNCGLLIPEQVVDETVEFAKTHEVDLNSLEGFIRQLIGWREFVKIVYDLQEDTLLKKNFFHHKRKIPEPFWSGKTSITPIDTTIEKIQKFAYCHHIERLMVLGNFMLLCEFDPHAIFRWFMELFIDAYDWVMMANVYAMSQYADGGTMTTKPYMSSSNYLLKMGDFEKGDWCQIWDALYWHFIAKHEKVFSKNPRMTMMLSVYKSMRQDKKKEFEKIAKSYLTKLD